MSGGLSDAPSLLWARPEEVEALALDNIQVVGHTPVFYISMRPNNLILCDTFSQFKDGRVIGDETLLLLEGKLSSNDWKMTAIGLDGEFAYDVK